MNRQITRGLALAASVAAIGLGASTTASAASPGDLCTVQNYGNSVPQVFQSLAGGLLYSIPSGHSFRVVAYAAGDNYYGRGNGQPEGYMWRGFVVQASCHQ